MRYRMLGSSSSAAAAEHACVSNRLASPIPAAMGGNHLGYLAAETGYVANVLAENLSPA